MGHKSVTTTQIYARVTDRKVDEDMKRLRERTSDNCVALMDESRDTEMKKTRRISFRTKTADGM